MPLRLAFLGNDQWSVPALEAIAGEPDLDVAVVLTNPPREAGRGSGLRPTAVAAAAARLGLPLAEVEKVGEGRGFDALIGGRPEVVVVVAFGELLTREVLEAAPLGALNLHFSLLPRWRGATPVQHAILGGDTRTGVTVMRMDAGLDTGPILNQLEEDIRPEDDAGSLGRRLATLGALLLVGVLRQLPQGVIPARPQMDAAATFAPLLTKADRVIDWADQEAAVVRRVRALSPEPAATTRFRGEGLKVFTAATAHDRPGGDTEPGTLVRIDDRGVLVATGSGGGVRLLEVGPAGRRRMTAASWARGARFEEGERLG